MGKEQNHDTFEGDIPVDLGKKKPVWIKFVGLGALACVLGAAAYILNSEQRQEDVMNATKSKVETFMTENVGTLSTQAENQIPAPSNQIDISLNDVQEESHTAEISQEDYGNDDHNLQQQNDSINLALGTQAQEHTSISHDLPAEQLPDYEPNPITITPPTSNNMTSTMTPNSNFADSQEFNDLKSTVNQIQQSQQERINVMKSGIDLQTVSLKQLEQLTVSLNSLKSELAQLNRQATTAPAKEKSATTHTPSKKKQPEPRQSVKKTQTSAKPNLILLGIDRWAGEEFAQLQLNNEIHLLAVHESLDGWRVSSINKNAVTVINDKGESFEITN